MKKYRWLVVGLILSETSIAQQQENYLSNEGFKRRINREFMNVASGQTNTALGNYLSIDPVTGSFSAKGILPIGSDKKPLSILSFRMDGSLLGNSPAALFTNSKINSGASVQMEYHFQLGGSQITYEGGEKANLHLQLAVLKSNRNRSKGHLREVYEKQAVERSYSQACLFEERVQRDIYKTERQWESWKFSADSMVWMVPPPALLDAAVDTLLKLDKKLNQLSSALWQAKKDADSIRQVLFDYEDLNTYKEIILDKEEAKTRAELESNAAVEVFSFNWLTGVAGVGKKKYYTYDPDLQYDLQIEEQKKETYQFGLVINRYRHNESKKRAYYLNAGVLRMRDNNASFLPTTEIKQEVEKVDGDTTRTISRTYNAFTDPIQNRLQWSLFGNWTFLFTKQMSGFHLSTVVDIRDHSGTLWHSGLGFVISLKSEKKDQPFINLEPYIQFQDILNEYDQDSKFYKRNEIGLRISLPFNFYTSKINDYASQKVR
ncbi:MAG: hypothetical protein EOO88_08920 [Pedobacter sp.]|nr:MAG: hypothetical protein EOO88_08920 [Pedobacter sp.]